MKNKKNNLVHILGVVEGAPVDMFDRDGNMSIDGPYTFDGERLISRNGKVTDENILGLSLVGWTFKPSIKIPTRNTTRGAKVYVRNSLGERCKVAYFAGMSDMADYPYSVYADGKTSSETDGYKEHYKYAYRA